MERNPLSGVVFCDNIQANETDTNYDDMTIIQGSGNVFRDVGDPNADIELMKASLAASIIRVLNEQELSVRQAGKLASVQYADISRVRNADLDKFSLEWLIKVLKSLEPSLRLSLSFS